MPRHIGNLRSQSAPLGEEGLSKSGRPAKALGYLPGVEIGRLPGPRARRPGFRVRVSSEGNPDPPLESSLRSTPSKVSLNASYHRVASDTTFPATLHHGLVVE